MNEDEDTIAIETSPLLMGELSNNTCSNVLLCHLMSSILAW